jgi:hypothetical protein
MARTDSGDALTGPRLKKPSSVAIHCNHKERRIDSHMASASDAPMLTSRCPKSARLHGISVTYHSSEGANQLLPSGSALLVQTGTRKSARQRSLWVRSQGPISASNSGRGNPCNYRYRIRRVWLVFFESFFEYSPLRDNAVTLFWAVQLVLWVIGTGRQLFGVFANFIQIDWLGDIGVKARGDSQFAISQHRARSNRYGG